MLNLLDIIAENRGGKERGAYAVCSSHPWVIDAAIQQALASGSLLHVESTGSQVNQVGGYSGNTPRRFATWIHAAAREAGLSPEQVLIGGDHIGPFPWLHEGSGPALAKAAQLVRDCVLAGYEKIHLDTSMPCADDATVPLDDRTIAERAAILCHAAEEASRGLSPPASPPLYVIGTEVPAPGGESVNGGPPEVTTVESVGVTLLAFRAAFVSRGLSAAWERVIALVVQPGAEFQDHVVFDYNAGRAQALSAALPSQGMVFEAHSTDYQTPAALANMVRDHFAILKVGPWLTFAFREAVFALAAIEREMMGDRKGVRLSDVRGELERAMLRDRSHWRYYYSGDEHELALSRAYSYGDRCRYYWHHAAVQTEVQRLLQNLTNCHLPPGLVSQYLPREYEALRAGRLEPAPEAFIRFHIQNVLIPYAVACGVGSPRSESGVLTQAFD
jgi:D-tagatose-1,6-bisphosphate aldolase subunit GatZ/KbaZ